MPEYRDPSSIHLNPEDRLDREIANEFAASYQQTLQELDILSVSIRSTPSKKLETLSELKRRIHTFKGECAMLGFEEPVLVCHEIESAIGDASDDSVSDELIFETVDWLRAHFNHLTGNAKQSAEPAAQFIKRVGGKPVLKPTPSKLNLPAMSANKTIVLSDAEMVADFAGESLENLALAEKNFMKLESAGGREPLDAIFRAFHSVKGIAAMMELDDIRALAHAAENILDVARSNPAQLPKNWIDSALSACDLLKTLVDKVQTEGKGGKGVYEMNPTAFDLAKKLNAIVLPNGRQVLGEILVQEGKVTPEVLNEVLAEQKTTGPPEKKVGELLVERGLVDSEDVVDALRKQDAFQVMSKTAVSDTVRVNSQRLDSLVDTLGELVIAQSMLSDRLSRLEKDDPIAARQLRHIEKLSRTLQESSLSLRMMTIRPVFEKMHRLVRDLCRKTGKQIELNLWGEETEIDKSVIDQLGDPLIHMIRNSCDHGIEENPADRVQAGKSPSGQIRLGAYHKAGEVVIELSDDGKGLSRDSIIKKAVARGLIQANANLTDAEVWNLIFVPGFSTAEKVTDISGRGVGMDVVRRTIQSIRGRIEISSVAGRGTTFRLILPLTLAMIDGLIVVVGKERYILPMLQIHEALKPTADQLVTAMERGEAVRVRKSIFPLYRIARIFGGEGFDDPTEGIILIMESDQTIIGLLVDRIEGINQIVIKPVSTGIPRQPAISGSAILPDGTVGLLLDIHGLISLSKSLGGESETGAAPADPETPDTPKPNEEKAP